MVPPPPRPPQQMPVIYVERLDEGEAPDAPPNQVVPAYLDQNLNTSNNL